MELRSGKTLGETEMKVDSDEDFEEEVPASLDGYATGGIERGRRVSPTRTESIDTAPLFQSPPFPTMDISSVRYRPASVTTSADLTSAHGLARSDTLESGKVNSNTHNIRFLKILHTLQATRSIQRTVEQIS